MSSGKCCFFTFTLSPKETGAKKKPRLVLDGQNLAFEANPTFLDIVLDYQLTISKQPDKVKKTMQQQVGSIALLSGKTYGTDKNTLRTAYIADVRSCWEYEASVHSNHAPPEPSSKLPKTDALASSQGASELQMSTS